DEQQDATNTSVATTSTPLEKVVLARRLDLRFAQSAYADVKALDILRKWKFASQPGGHLFYLCPGGEAEFFGCTPERLFDVVTPSDEHCDGSLVVSEALAGTRPRGSTPAADQELSRQLFSSVKDQAENQITGKFIMEAFEELDRRGWVEKTTLDKLSLKMKDVDQELGGDYVGLTESGATLQGRYFVRRLRHLQHICQQFQCELSSSAFATAAIQHLLTTLHPTPATPNAAWATAFIEELIRNGITQFYICPGSRSTPLVAAVAKAVRSNAGVVHALSVHDERGAAFRALGYGRGNGKPAAVITSSGTAIANLYPAVVEAGMDAVPLLLLTADRPYESRDTGANQAIDQVKAFSSSYVRWFRDFLPPHDDVPVSVALADAAHGVALTKSLMGPVHLNIQFRENLAPDAGPIRNDDRAGSVTNFNNVRFTDSSGFQRWSLGGRQWTTTAQSSPGVGSKTLLDVLGMMMESKRGIIVVGNIRKPIEDDRQHDDSRTTQLISKLAQALGFPVFAGVQSGGLRFQSAAVVPYAEHVLRCPRVQQNLRPDFVLQLGAPLITTEIPKIIKETMDHQAVNHVLVHPFHSSERADPEFTVCRSINTDIDTFVNELLDLVASSDRAFIGSQLAPIVDLGRSLQKEMPKIIEEAANDMRRKSPDFEVMTEPEVVMKLAEVFESRELPDLSLFLSNSMPVRDTEAFLYPSSADTPETGGSLVGTTAVNRGASGIDGVIASAAGFADSIGRPTSLLIGDVAALHDINSLHALRTGMTAAEAQVQKLHPLTTIVLNNDGGGIFSFLPIAQHGSDVSFDEFFGTPTNTFSFEKGAAAFDLPFKKVTNSSDFKDAYVKAIQTNEPSLIEVIVAPRDVNVAVHRDITARSNVFLSSVLNDDLVHSDEYDMLPIKWSRARSTNNGEDAAASGDKTLVLLHGWMGDQYEWDNVESRLLSELPPEWSILSLDLPGHGMSKLCKSSLRDALRIEDGSNQESCGLSVDEMALAVARTLKGQGIDTVDAVAGYSLGGRVALAIKRLSMFPTENSDSSFTVVDDDTRLILVSTYPGDINTSRNRKDMMGIGAENVERIVKDEKLANEMDQLANTDILSSSTGNINTAPWSQFLHRWYGAPLWGSLRETPHEYSAMLERRISTLSARGPDIAEVLRQCSPPKCSTEDWRGVNAAKTLFITGGLDRKYCGIGREWADLEPNLGYAEVANRGHALLVEAGDEVAQAMAGFLQEEKDFQSNEDDTKIWDANFIPSTRTDALTSQSPPPTERKVAGSIGSLDFEAFSIGLVDESGKDEGVAGIGWGEQARPTGKESLKQRKGYFVQLLSQDGLDVGIGEVSPLKGLHSETLQMAEDQMERMATSLSKLDPSHIPSFDAMAILSLDGSLDTYITSITSILGEDELLPSVRAGVEMALLSLSSQAARVPIHKAIMMNSPNSFRVEKRISSLPLNGLLTRSSREDPVTRMDGKVSYPSWKAKIGHQSLEEDIESFQSAMAKMDRTTTKIRADANRAFDQDSYSTLVSSLRDQESPILERLEYIEEPLEKQVQDAPIWSLETQVNALENCYTDTQIPYALDESMSDLMKTHSNNVTSVIEDLVSVFADSSRGCVAMILKPSLLGLENSLRLARFARSELGISAVFTSSFDSGIGLAYTSFLGSISDASPSKGSANLYPHGLGTFEMLTSDSLAPPFGSYVNREGLLNVASLSRAFYGLALDELQSLSSESVPPTLPTLEQAVTSSDLFQAEPETDQTVLDFPVDEFEASTSSSGRDIVLVASLPLPFSADIACSRFTDLPQQPRWSPWLASVAYLDAGSETEWTLRVRGVNFRWRAQSEMLESPYKGIRWQSTSGVKNTGVVEFIPPSNGNTGSDSCTMKVRMAFVVPRLLSSLFRGTIVEDFLRNKIMKWSLEMFRDVVKGDLALEEGNIELGDALFGAVEGKASAIEATLASSSRGSSPSSGTNSTKD
ncbi:MAG: hypothetical protein SGILL_003825, partial [Bacillariaceae sp.]